MLVFVLVMHLINGDISYDDTMDKATCHAFAEALKEGGSVEVDGYGVISVETAQCIEDWREPI